MKYLIISFIIFNVFADAPSDEEIIKNLDFFQSLDIVKNKDSFMLDENKKIVSEDMLLIINESLPGLESIQ